MNTASLLHLLLTWEIGFVASVVKRLTSTMEDILVTRMVALMLFIQDVRREKMCGMGRSLRESQKR